MSFSDFWVKLICFLRFSHSPLVLYCITLLAVFLWGLREYSGIHGELQGGSCKNTASDISHNSCFIYLKVAIALKVWTQKYILNTAHLPYIIFWKSSSILSCAAKIQLFHFVLQRRHNERDSASNYRRLDCLLNRLLRHRSKKTSKLRVTGLCEGNPPVAGAHKRLVTQKMFLFDDVMQYD